MYYTPLLILILLTPSSVMAKKKYYQPSLETSWHWQLDGKLNMKRDVDLYIVDLFDTKVCQIQRLHQSKKKVIAYFSAGSYEAWRKDAKDFPKAVLGEKMDGWDERWLDIKNPKVRAIMIARLKLARRKGFDGVEADNVDGYENETGFDLSAQQQQTYNIFLAKQAHRLGLAIALKNDVEQIEALEPYFDFHINEECHVYAECNRTRAFIQHNKPVFNAEYDPQKHQEFCKKRHKGFHMLTLPLGLNDSFRMECRP